jgi:hypothetical protein
MLEDVLRKIKPIFIEKNMKKRGLLSYLISHFLRSKTGEIGPSASCRAINSLQNPIYGYAWEFHFSDHIFIQSIYHYLIHMMAKVLTKLRYIVAKM